MMKGPQDLTEDELWENTEYLPFADIEGEQVEMDIPVQYNWPKPS